MRSSTVLRSADARSLMQDSSMLRASFASVNAGMVYSSQLSTVSIAVEMISFMLPLSGSPLCSMASISDAACVTGR